MHKKKNFNFSGAAEMSYAYFHTAFMGAIRSIDDIGLAVVSDGVGWTHGGIRGTIRMKDKIIRSKGAVFENKYSNWKRKWSGWEKDLFHMASRGTDWRRILSKQDRLNYKYWQECYFLDTIDNFADEINGKVLAGMLRAGIEEKYLSELISPEELTHAQIINRDIARLKEGRSNRKYFLRKRWHMHANWNGGELLDDKLLARDLREKIIPINLAKRRQLHRVWGKKLDAKTLDLVRVIRVVSLWREDRKAFMQMLTLAAKRAVELMAAETGHKYDDLIWATTQELLKEKIDIALFRHRHNASVLIAQKGGKKSEIIIGASAQKYIKEFIQSEKPKQLKGTIASPGHIQGRAKVIIKKGEFDNFKKGDILVTTMTRPEFLPLMKKARAVVTDEGGLTCHAAIVSRELNLPCIVGTKYATRVLKDGDLIEIDAIKGVVRIIGK